MSCTDVQTIQAGNGTKTQFSFDFPYIFKSEIHVYFWNATTKEWDEKLTTDATHPWRITDANPTIVEFTSTAPPSPATPVDPGEPTVDNVRIRRITNIDDIRALFNPGSAIRSDDLNNNFEQLRYAIQEANCQGVPEDIQSYLEEYYWDRFDNTLYSADTWRSDDATIATTAALDQRFQDEVAETITSTESWPSNDDTVGTTLAVENRVTAKIDDAITNDIGADSSGITVTDDGDGTITLSIEDGDLALTKIDPNAVITSAETWANNDDTIATTAKIDDVIDDAITGDILIDSTGLTKSTSGGQTTLGIGAGSVDIDRIKAENIITEAEQDSGTTETDDNLFTAVAAAKRFDTLVQTNNPGTTTNWEVGKTWLQNDDDLTLSIYNGTGWTAVTSGGTFTEQPSVVYVDQASGDDNNTGHRISTPKATIRAAINQINAEIDVEITNGGSGYVESTYNGVSLTGGTGTGLTADIVVNASGVVTTVTVNNTTTLEDYNIGDVLSANNADLGGSGSGLQITVTGDGDGQIVIVSAGTYQEIAPIQIKRRNVSVIGQAMRSCIVHPTSATELNNLFELNSGSYIANLTLTGMQAGTGTGNTLDAVLPTDQGWNFAFYNNAFITKSPYIQNCTNFSDSEIDNDDLRSHRPRGGQAGDTDSAPTGGGLLVNGATPHADSPLRSMVADSYTHVALNGPGILVTNNGYTQITSSYAFFNTYHIKCLNGGQANLAASTTDFGDRSLVADGRSTSAIFTSNVDGAANSGATSFNVNQPTAGTGWFGDTQRPAGNMLVEVNSVTYPILSATPNTDSEGGDGWTVTISRPDPNNRSNNLGLNGAIADDAAVSFFLRSMIASSGHTMEYVGSGTNYTALPENGGVPDETRQITESNNGKVWTAITDHNGKFRIGGNQTDDPIFEVDQQLGFVTIPEGSIAFNLLSDETPQLGGNLDANGNDIILDTGAAATPSLTFDGDTNTGLYSPGADQVAISTGGTARLYIAADGDVGIKTTNPNGDLSFGSTASVINLDTSDGADNKRLVLNGGGGGFSSGRGGFIALSGNEATNPGNVQITMGNVSGTGIVFNKGDGTSCLNIDSSGNVGVGTTSPSNTLDIGSGNIEIGGGNNTALTWSSDVSSHYLKFTTALNGLTLNGYGGLAFETNGANERMRIDSSGRLGIGTSSPSSPLNVRGADATEGDAHGTLILEDTAAYNANPIAGVIFRGEHASNGSKAYFSSVFGGKENATDGNYSGYLAFATRVSGSTAAERMRITSAGNVGIGITSLNASRKVEIVQPSGYTSGLRIRTGGSGAYNEYFSGVSNWKIGSPHNANALVFTGDGNERARIDSSGRLLVGTSSSRSVDNEKILQIEGVNQQSSSMSLTRNTNSSAPPNISFGKSRGSTLGSNTIVQSGDSLGVIVFCGADGSDTNSIAAAITGQVDGTPGSNDMPGRLVFSVTRDGSASPTGRAQIDNAGRFYTFNAAGTEGAAFMTEEGAGTTYQIFGGWRSATTVGGASAQNVFRVYTNGDTQNTNNSYTGISDIKLKENVVDAASQWSDIKSLQVRKYNFKVETGNQTHTQIGLIAQEVELVSPGLVNESPDRDAEGNDLGTVTKSVNYSVLYMKAVKALQEAMERIETLEQRLNDAGIS